MTQNADDLDHPYLRAQTAIAQLKSAVYAVLNRAGKDGLRNADIGRLLGIYMGHVEHEGHIPRTLLAMMEEEGVVVQEKSTKRWRLKELSEFQSSAVGPGEDMPPVPGHQSGS